MTHLLEFGFRLAEWNAIFPTYEQFKIIPNKPFLKLESIEYQQEYGTGPLCSFQMSLKNIQTGQMITGPFYSTRQVETLEVKKIHVGSENEIAAISVKADQQKGEIYGLRLYDYSARKIVEEIFDKSTVAAWHRKVIPPGHRIIGYQCNTREFCIERLGFLLWCPEPSNKQQKEFDFDEILKRRKAIEKEMKKE